MGKSTVLDLSQVIKNLKGNAVKDMIDPPEGQSQQNAPDLTVGSFIVGALTLGIVPKNMKDSFKIFQIAQKVELAMKDDGGKMEIDAGELSRLEEMLGKVENPAFLGPLHVSYVEQAIQKAKKELEAS